MAQVDRFSVSLDTELLAAFDRHIAQKGYENRSEAVRDMIRDLLVSSRVSQGSEDIAGLLTVIVDNREGEVARNLRSALAREVDIVRGSLHITLDDHRDRFAIALHGSSDRVLALANGIRAMRGIAHGQFSAVPQTE